MEFNLDVDLSPKQIEIFEWCKLGNSIQYIGVSTGRQVGKTTISTLAALDWCLSTPNYSVGFFLPTYKQCKNVFKRYKKMLQGLVKIKYVSFIASPEFILTFANGSTIQFFTSDNDNCRSFTFDSIVVDEACFVKDSIWHEAIHPTVAVSLSKLDSNGRSGNSGKVLVVSTPKTKNWFYQMVTTDILNSHNKRVTRFTSVQGGIISKEIIAAMKKGMPENAFKNEYMGEFLDSGSGMFKYKTCISNIKHPKLGFVAAIDIASKDDWTDLTIQNKQGDVIFKNRWRHQEYENILETIIKVLKEYGSPKCYIETNGVGQMPYEYLKKRYKNTHPWVTSNTSKNNIILQLILDFNTQNISIPDLEYLKEELDFFTMEWVNGKPVYGGSNGSHDDGVMSLAICNYHRDKVGVSFDISYINKKQQPTRSGRAI